MLVKYSDSASVNKWRISFEYSKVRATFLLVENMSIRFGASSKVGNIEKPAFPSMFSMGYPTADTLFKNGDEVVLVPTLDPPDLAQKDDNGVYIAYQILVRRAGGSAEFNNELNSGK